MCLALTVSLPQNVSGYSQYFSFYCSRSSQWTLPRGGVTSSISFLLFPKIAQLLNKKGLLCDVRMMQVFDGDYWT